MSRLPGGALARRPLHFIWIADSSGSMAHGGKIQALNNAIREAIPHMQQVSGENPIAEVLVRAVGFSRGARWHIAPSTPMENFRWVDLSADGETDMGRALKLVAEELDPEVMPRRALPPVLVLISDGKPTDDYRSGLRTLMDQPWGKKAVRIAIAIGDDADKDVLQRFIGHPELEPLEARNADSLVKYIRWVSTAVLQSASSPASQTVGASPGVNVPLPPPPDADIEADDVW